MSASSSSCAASHEALDLRYHSEYSHADFVKFINRAKDELVTPDDFEAWVDSGARHLRGALRRLRGDRRAARDDRHRAAAQGPAPRTRAFARGSARADNGHPAAIAPGQEARKRPRPEKHRGPGGPPRDSRATVTPTAERLRRRPARPDRRARRGLRARRRRLRDPPPRRARPRLSRLRGGPRRARRPRLRGADRPRRRACSRSAPTSCAAGSAATATSWWTSSRTPTSPRSSSSSSSAARRIARTT